MRWVHQNIRSTLRIGRTSAALDEKAPRWPCHNQPTGTRAQRHYDESLSIVRQSQFHWNHYFPTGASYIGRNEPRFRAKWCEVSRSIFLRDDDFKAIQCVGHFNLTG